MPSAVASTDSTTSPASSRLPAPFLKWVGGKRQLLPVILGALPSGKLPYYAELFLGGGAVFFELVRQERVERALLCDTNAELIDAYEAVRDDIDAVLDALEGHTNDQEHYYAVRALDPDTLSRPARAARTIFLNRCGYNGLYRVNASGKFNVPFGRYENPNIRDERTLRAASRALQRAELRKVDFAAAAASLPEGTVAYFDPPYVPLSATSSFTSYTRQGFDMADQRRLRDVASDLKRRGVHVVLSNSSAPAVHELYAGGFECIRVPALRAINCQPDGRGAVAELLIR